MNVIVTYEGIEFQVEGNWIPHITSSLYEPSMDGYIDEYFIYHETADFTQWLSQEAIEGILLLATKEYSGVLHC